MYENRLQNILEIPVCIFSLPPRIRSHVNLASGMLGTGIRRMNGPMGHIAQKRIFRYTPSQFSARDCVKFFEICLRIILTCMYLIT